MKPARLEALDAWRGICALLVCLEHLNVDSVLHTNELVHHSYRFVDFFFVLSGFVIAHAYRDRLKLPGGLRAFMIRRIGRLWPLHAVVLGAFVLFEVGVLVAEHVGISIGRAPFSERHTLASIPANLALVHSWGILDHSTWNVPSWSISTEVLAYAVFGTMCAVLAARWISGVAAILLVGSAAVILAAPDGMASTFDFGVFRCVFGFMTGVLVRALWSKHQARFGTVGELVVVAAVVVGVTFLPQGWPALLVTPLFAVAVWVFASEDGAASRFLKTKVPQALGAWSYSIYMVHALIVLVMLAGAVVATKYGFKVFGRIDDVATIIGPSWLTTMITVSYLGLVLLLARFTYRYIEMPGQRLFARFSRSPER